MRSHIIAYCFMILLLAAHFSRADHNAIAVLVLFVPVLLFIKKRWVIQLLPFVGYLASIAWLFSAYQYIQLRIANGEGWVRLLLIMGTIAVYSAWSGYFLNSPALRDNYKSG